MSWPMRQSSYTTTYSTVKNARETFPRRLLKKVQMRGGARKPHARRTFCTLNVRSRAPHSRRWAFFSSLLARRSRAARTGAVSFSTGLLTLGPWVVRTALADLFAQMLALLGRHLAPALRVFLEA